MVQIERVKKPKIRLEVRKVAYTPLHKEDATDIPPRWFIYAHTGVRFRNHQEAISYSDSYNDPAPHLEYFYANGGATPEEALEQHAPSGDDYDILPMDTPITRISIKYESGREDVYYSLMDYPSVDPLGQFYVIYGMNGSTVSIRISTINKMVVQII